MCTSLAQLHSILSELFRLWTNKVNLQAQNCPRFSAKITLRSTKQRETRTNPLRTSLSLVSSPWNAPSLSEYFSPSKIQKVESSNRFHSLNHDRNSKNGKNEWNLLNS